jgi:hypothetical protein
MSKKDVHSIQLDELYIEALVDILVFTGQTAAFLANEEVTAGRAGKNLLKLARLANDSKDILVYLKESIGIGEPSLDMIN